MTRLDEAVVRLQKTVGRDGADEGFQDSLKGSIAVAVGVVNPEKIQTTAIESLLELPDSSVTFFAMPVRFVAPDFYVDRPAMSIVEQEIVVTVGLAADNRVGGRIPPPFLMSDPASEEKIRERCLRVASPADARAGRHKARAV